MPVGNDCPFAEEAGLPLSAEGSWGLGEMGGRCSAQLQPQGRESAQHHCCALLGLLRDGALIASWGGEMVPEEQSPSFKGSGVRLCVCTRMSWAGAGDSGRLLPTRMGCLGKDWEVAGRGICTQRGRGMETGSIRFSSAKQEMLPALEWPGACNEVIYLYESTKRKKIAVGLFLI